MRRKQRNGNGHEDRLQFLFWVPFYKLPYELSSRAYPSDEKNDQTPTSARDLCLMA